MSASDRVGQDLQAAAAADAADACDRNEVQLSRPPGSLDWTGCAAGYSPYGVA